MNKNIIIGLCIFILIIGMVSALDLYMNKTHPNCSDTSVVRANNTINTPYCDFDALTYSDRVLGGDTLYVVSGNYNHEYDRNWYANNVTDNVLITSVGGQVNLSSYVAAYAVEDNGLWQNISGTFGVPNLWNTTLTLDSYVYPIVQFANHTEFIAFECYNQTVSTTDGVACSAGDWLTKYSTFYGCWLANTTSKQMRCIFPGGENPNNISLFISEEYDTLVIRNNPGIGNITIQGINFQYTRRALMPRNSSGIIIQNNTFDEGMYGIIVWGGHQRGGTTIRNNTFNGNHPLDMFYDQFIKETNEESDCIITNNDVVQPIYVYGNNFYNVNGGIALITDAPNETCGSQIYDNVLNSTAFGGYESMIEIEAYCCNSSYYNNTVFDDRLAGVSLGGANATEGRCNFHHNTIYGSDSIVYNETSTWLYYALKAYYAVGTVVTNWNISHNTFIGKQAAWLGLDSATHELYNTTVKDNIFISNYSTSVVQKTGEASQGNFWDYNLYYNLLGGNLIKWYMNDTLTTSYATLALAKASPSWDGTWDINSIESDPLFLSITPGDANYLQPNYNSPACDAASDGGDIGAVPCVVSPVEEFVNCSNLTIYNPSGETLTDFPVMILVNNRTGMQSDFDDVRFYTGTCGAETSTLYAELEAKTDGSNATTWIKMNLTAGNNNFAMRYGNSTATSNWDSAGNVWNSNTKAVYLLNGSAKDSTINGYSGNITGAQQTLGIIGNAYYFNGSYWDIQTNLTLANTTSFSISGWMYRLSNTVLTYFTLARDASGVGTGLILRTSITGIPLFYCNGVTTTGGTAIPVSSWHLLTAMVNTSGTYIFIDGVLNKTGSPANCSISTNLRMGRQGATDASNGTIDDVRIYNTSLSSGWVNASYQLVANYDDFISFGDEDAAEPIVSIINSGFSTLDSTPSVSFNFTDNSSGTANCSLYVNNGYCYQESYNVSNQTGIDGDCGLNYGGNYVIQSPSGTITSLSNAFDGNYSTRAIVGCGGGGSNSVTLNITYVKPAGALSNNNSWRVSLRDGDFSHIIPDDCMDYASNLSLQVSLSCSSAGFSYDYVYCYNGSWKQLINYSHGFGVGQAYLYDEAMNWSIIDSNNFVSVANNGTVINNTLTNLTSTSLSDANYLVYVNCTDLSGNTGMSSLLNFTVDTSITSVSNLASPFIGETWIYLNWTNPSDSDFNHTEVFRNETSIANLSVAYINSSGLDYLTGYTYRLVPVDDLGNRGSNATITNITRDLTKPTVNILNVSFNTTDTTPSISFNYTDLLSSTANCSLYFNGLSKSNNASTLNNSLTVLTSTLLSDGLYSVFVNCTDNGGNINSSTIISVFVDSVSPVINISNPLSGTNISIDTLNITYYLSHVEFEGLGFDYFNISLLDEFGFFISTLVGNNSDVLSFVWDGVLTNYSPGSYGVRVDAINASTGVVFASGSTFFDLVTDAVLNVTAFGDGVALDNFTITLSPGGSTVTTSGVVLVGIFKNFTYTVSISDSGYAISSVTLNWSNDTNYLVFNLSALANSIYIVFRDQDNLSLLPGINISLDLISGVFADNYSTDTSNLTINGLNVTNYTLRYGAVGYATRFYGVEVTNQSTQNLTLYMILLSSSSNVTVTVIDQNANPVQDAVVKALKYDLSTNSYLLQEVGTTNVEGETILSLTMFDEYYKFMVEYEDELETITSPAYITSNSLTIQILLGSLVGESYYEYAGIYTDLMFNTVTDNFRLDYDDVDGLVDSVCLQVYTLGLGGEVYFNESCSVSASGALLVSVTPVNGTTYLGRAYYFEDGVRIYLDSESYTYPRGEVFGKVFGLLLQVILTVFCAFLAVWSLPLAAILVPLSLVLGRLLQFNFFGWDAIAAVVVVGLIIAYVTRKDNG